MSYEREQANVPGESNIQPEDLPDEEPVEPENVGGDPPDNTGGNTVVSDI